MRRKETAALPADLWTRTTTNQNIQECSARVSYLIFLQQLYVSQGCVRVYVLVKEKRSESSGGRRVPLVPFVTGLVTAE